MNSSSRRTTAAADRNARPGESAPVRAWMWAIIATAMGVLGIGAFRIGTALAGEAPPIRVPQDYAEIQAAIDAAPGRGGRVVVEPGNYAGPIDFRGKDLLLTSVDPGNDEVVATTIIDGAGSSSPVVRFATVDTTQARGAIYGFTITGGNAASGAGLLIDGAAPTVWRCVIQANATPDNGSGRGGGVACLNGAAPHFEACAIQDNSAAGGGLGGGAYWDSLSTPLFDDCSFTRNLGGSGGGIYVLGRGEEFPGEERSAAVRGGEISDNRAENDGGGAYLRDANPLLSGCEIRGNRAKGGAGLYLLGESAAHFDSLTVSANATTNGEGGGAYILFADSLQSLWDHCFFESDTAEFHGGGAYILGASPTFVRCSFVANELRADWNAAGGAVFCEGSRATFSACAFDSNRSIGVFGGSGGALYSRGSQPLLENCVLSRNSARTSGGALTFEREAGESPALVPEVRNCTIVWNRVDNYDSGAITMIGWSRPLIQSSIVWFNDPAGIDTLQGIPEVIYSCIADGWEGEGNLRDAPLLVTTPPYVWGLHPLSPCIDSGVGEVDGVNWVEVDTLYSRFNAPSTDMGVYGGPLAALWFADIVTE